MACADRGKFKSRDPKYFVSLTGSIVKTEFLNPFRPPEQEIYSWHFLRDPQPQLRLPCRSFGSRTRTTFYKIFSARQILFPKTVNGSIFQIHQNYLPTFVTNFVFQLQARSEIPRHCQGHIAPPKVQVASLSEVRSRRECGDFQRPIERKRYLKLPLSINTCVLYFPFSKVSF